MAALTWIKVQFIAILCLAAAPLSLVAVSVAPWVLVLLPAALIFYAMTVGGGIGMP